MTKNEVEFSAPLWGRTMHMVLDLVLLIASVETIYSINGPLQPILCPPECTPLITYNHPTLVPLTQKRTRLQVWLVQCVIIWVIFEQASHIKCVRDISIIQWLKHISIVLNFSCHIKRFIIALLQFSSNTKKTTSPQMCYH